MKKILMIRLILMFSFISMSGLILLGCNLIKSEHYFIENNSLKSSANEILIGTPENKTYSTPMSGYYPATYGFENDEPGADPIEWTVYEGAGYVNVKDEMNNHQRVVELYDSINTNHNELHGSFSVQTYGTVEYWILSDEVTMANQFTLMDDQAGGVYQTGIGWLDLDEDKIRYEDNTGWHDTSKIVYDNTWYHIKVEFECSTGNFNGLAQQTWRFFVNGEEFGDFPFKNAIDNVSQVYFFTRGGDSHYRCYIDAVGFSWDPNYNIGDNMDEGLLLSFDTSFTPDWMGYSLDGLANKTILGDVTIPMPAVGSHNVQVFGNDSLGTNYISEIQYFTIISDNSLVIIISVAIGASIGAVGAILLIVFLIRKRRAKPPRPPKPPKPLKPAIRPRTDLKIPPKQEKKIVPPGHVIVQREVIVIEKKPSERERLDRETERRTDLEGEKERKQKKCLYCGNLIDYYARICPKCGNEQK